MYMWCTGNLKFNIGHKKRQHSLSSFIIWPCLKRTGNKQIQEFDWLKSILTAV